jgi:hypothetical protein
MTALKTPYIVSVSVGNYSFRGGNSVSSEPWIQTPLGRAIPWRVSEYDDCIVILAKVLFGRSVYRAHGYNKDCY